MEFHDAANIFPIQEESIGELADDIAAHGQKTPIETLGGKIIDGRRRWLACQRNGIKPKVQEISVDDPIAYVLSLNLYRRHLTIGERALVGARARELYDRQAKERQRASGGDRTSKKAVPANLPEPLKGDARDQAGKAVGVSGKLIDHATKVLKEGTPELIKAVEEGRMAVTTAAVLASEPEEKQREELDNPRRRRDYRSTSKSLAESQDDDREEPATAPTGRRSRAIELANEAINSLILIPINDPLRKRGFQIVTDWIRRNK